MFKRIFCEIMLILLLLSMLTSVFHVSSIRIESATRIYLDPSNHIFDANNITIYTRFNVTVLVENVLDLAAFQVKMYFNDDIINVTRWFEPKWDPNYVFYGNTTLAAPSPPTVSYTHVGLGNASAMMGVSLFPTTQPKFNGNGKLCIIEFYITAMPTQGESLSCTLKIDTSQTVLLDSGAMAIPALKENGFYALSWAPKPYITQPLNCSLISGNVIDVFAVEMNYVLNIINTTFEYARSEAGPWTFIGVDLSSVGGWKISWPLTGLIEGDYYVRATMVNDVSQSDQDVSHVWFDRFPPIPELTAPAFPKTVTGLANFTMTTSGDEIDMAEVWRRAYTWEACLVVEKNVANISQHKINATNNPAQEGLPNWLDGNYSCGPTAAASCLAYWAQFYDKLYDQTKGNTDGDEYDDGIEEMARAIYKASGWGVGGPGGTCEGLTSGINAYINGKIGAGKLEAKMHKPASLYDAIGQFLDCQDVLLCINITAKNETHIVTLRSLHFKEMVDPILDYYPPVTEIDIMDPDDGENKTYTINPDKNEIGGQAVLLCMITVCPSPTVFSAFSSTLSSPSWISIGNDFDGSDGWSIQWDTTQLPDRFYLIKATMTDTLGHTGTDLMIVYTHNARVTDINSTKTVVGEKYNASIQVHVENLYVESALFNITLYCNETFIETRNVTLTSQTSTILNFIWNTTGMPKGNYTIRVKAIVLLNDTHLARVTYIDGWIVITTPGDIDGDFDVDIYDVVKITNIYGFKLEDPGFNPNSDLDDDGEITIYDVVRCTSHYGQT